MIGRTLLHYRITEKLGAGGMGEVYRAADTRLRRDVALKVLPAAFARDPEWLARFEREARVLAALNHPNIAAIHGFEQADGVSFLVLEYVPGPTLAAAGRLEVPEALRVAGQIAEALDAAHEKGFIHRDLKPANIKIAPQGQVKVLDFGLAKAFGDPQPEGDPSASPTLSAAPTRAGAILGTPAYMSPEQARGKPLDRRTDIWSFGCVFYEMLAGREAFGGESVSDSLSAVLGREPDWSALPAATPPAAQRLLRRCLEKDPKRRLRDIGDAWTEMGEQAPASGAPPGVSRFGWPLALAAAVAVIAAGVAVWSLWLRPAAPAAVARLAMTLPPTDRLDIGQQTPATAVVISQDGRRLVYAATRGQGGSSQLYLRRLDQLEASPIPGTQGAAGPFFSPDGEWVGFFGDGKMKKVPVTGGSPFTLCDAVSPRGATWGPDDTIVFTPRANPGIGGLWRISAAGGAPRALTTPDLKKGELGHRHPEFLPDGKAVLFTIWTGASFDEARVGVLDLESGAWRALIDGGHSPSYASGQLLFSRAGTLLAAPFDSPTRATKGPAVSVLQGLLRNVTTGLVHYSVSRSGLLAYVTGIPGAVGRTLLWVDRKGAARPASQEIRPYIFPSLSPDGRRLALLLQEGVNRNVWVYELDRGALTRLTVEAGFATRAVWTPDGKRVVYGAARPASQGLFWRPADGSGPEEQIAASTNLLYPGSVSPDGKTLTYVEMDPREQGDLWTLSLEGDRKPRPLLESPYDEQDGAVSPDGRWIAYRSNVSGRYEVYVQAFPGPGPKTQVSTGGGVEPLWARGFRELFYRHGNRMMVVETRIGPAFVAGAPRALFEAAYDTVAGPAPMYDVSPDGQRFLMLKSSEPDAAFLTQVNVVLNWPDEMKRRSGLQGR